MMLYSLKFSKNRSKLEFTFHFSKKLLFSLSLLRALCQRQRLSSY